MFDSETAMPRYILGPHFYIFIPTWFISLGLLIFVLYTVATRASSWLIVLSFFSGINFLFFYAKTGLSLPGIASQPREPLVVDLRSERYCVPCRIIREPGTKHCYYCDVCIYKMDHHCPWIGKCVGRDNLCLFYQFLLSVFFMMVCLIFTTVTANPVSSTLTSWWSFILYLLVLVHISFCLTPTLSWFSKHSTIPIRRFFNDSSAFVHLLLVPQSIEPSVLYFL